MIFIVSELTRKLECTSDHWKLTRYPDTTRLSHRCVANFIRIFELECMNELVKLIIYITL